MLDLTLTNAYSLRMDDSPERWLNANGLKKGFDSSGKVTARETRFVPFSSSSVTRQPRP
jgi:hypothetical protein